MIRGLAIPYERFSRTGVGLSDYWCEVISKGAFSRSVNTGRSLKTGKPVFACLGHRRNGRKRWKIADTTSGLRLWEQDDGVWFELAGIDLPLTFTGVSIKLEPLAWRREADLLWRLTSGGIRHIAILTGDPPAYPQTFLETIRASKRTLT